jgi:hypothetical protein
MTNPAFILLRKNQTGLTFMTPSAKDRDSFGRLRGAVGGPAVPDTCSERIFPRYIPALGKLIGVLALGLAQATPQLDANPLMLGSGPVHTPQTFAFQDVNVVPMDRERVLQHQTVVVRNWKVAAIGTSGKIRIPSDATVIECKGTEYLMPGLADMHIHSDNAQDMPIYAANGITTALHMGGASSDFVSTIRHQIDAGEIVGPHVFVAFFMDGPGGKIPSVAFTPQNSRQAIRKAKMEGYEFIKVYNVLSAETFHVIIDEAKHQHLAVVGHGVRAVPLSEAMRDGQVMIAHAEEYIYTYFHGLTDVALIPAAVSITKYAGAFVTPNLSTYATITEQRGHPEEVEAYLKRPEAKFLRPDLRQTWRSSGYATRSGDLTPRLRFLRKFVKALCDGGVPLLLGTDSPDIPGMFPGFSIHEDLRELVLAGLSPYQALSAGTRIPGEFIHRTVPHSESFGTVKVGTRADLLLLDRNPLESVENVKNPLGVMLDGRWHTRADLKSRLDQLAVDFGKD